MPEINTQALVRRVKARLAGDAKLGYASQSRVLGLGAETWRLISLGKSEPSQKSVDALLAYVDGPRPKTEFAALMLAADIMQKAVDEIRAIARTKGDE